MERLILHVDANCFYASVEMLYHPEFQGVPLAVGGNAETRHGIILAKNYLAKSFGVKTGEALWEAKGKCPGLVIVPPNYPRYMRFSKKMRKIFYDYSDHIEPFGLDEAYIDITGSAKLLGKTGREIAEEISTRIREALGITVSIGISWNKIFAKFGSDYQKPDAITEITHTNYQKIVWPQPVGDLLYVGRATVRKLKQRGIETVGALAQTPSDILRGWFGKMGEILWRFANGLDETPVRVFDPELNDVHYEIKGIGNAITTHRDLTNLNEVRMVLTMLSESVASRVRDHGFRGNVHYEIKGIGNAITTHRDLTNLNEVRMVLTMLSESVASRVRDHGFRGNVVGIHIRDKDLISCSRQMKLDRYTNITREISDAAYALFKKRYRDQPVFAIRSLGVRVTGLAGDHMPLQLSLFRDERERIRQEKLDAAIDDCRRRFGNNSVRRANTLRDPLSELDIKRDNVIHPVGFFR